MKFLKIFFLIISTLVISWIAALSFWPEDPTENILVCNALSSQRNIKGTTDGQEGAILVWEDPRTIEETVDIYAQHLSTIGALLWDATGVAVMKTFSDNYDVIYMYPQIITDESGGAYICCMAEVDYPDTDIYLQHISATGEVSWQATGVPVVVAQFEQYDPCLVKDDEGGVFVVWSDCRNNRYESVIYAQRFNPAGEPLWETNGIRICPTSYGEQQFPGAVSDGEGGVIVSWSDSRYGAPTFIFSQRVDKNGSPLWNPEGVQVLNCGWWQHYPKIVSDDSGGAIITGLVYDFDEKFYFFAQRLNPEGEPLWETNGVKIIEWTPSWWLPPFMRLITDNSNGAIFAWNYVYYENEENYVDYYSQHIDPQGNLLWNAEGVSIIAGLFQDYWAEEEYIEIVSDQSGGFIASWDNSSDNNLDNLDIFAQRIDAFGNTIWNATGVPISIAYLQQIHPCIVNSYSGSAILAWQDERDEGYEHYNIYAQKVFDDGTLPVELAYFTATNQADQILLKWGTESEENNLGWNIYRSGSREGSFTKINPQLIPGSGNSSTPTDYIFKDENVKPFKKYTYYLQQIDFDGTTSHSHYVTSSPEHY